VLLLTLTTANSDDPGGIIRKILLGKIFSALADVDPLTGTSQADGINELVNSWILGGITDLPDYGVIPGGTQGQQGDNTCKVSAAPALDSEGENILVNYLGPQYTFQFPLPAGGWPPPSETFPAQPGALSNIDHIVVLMMENRSFDHMLGYLSLPVGQGGMGRADIDGLRGNESNSLIDGTLCPSAPFQTGETIFAPDPPHSTDPVGRAINGGKMDGFAREYAYANGPVVAPNIMKYHTAANLPAYDAMARDFAICQRWFASHPGLTFCNRFHTLTGRLNIDPYGFWEFGQSSPLRTAFTDTIFDHLCAAGVTWKYFEHYYCYLRLFERHTFDNDNIFDFDDPGLGFLNVAASGQLPSVTFIDPHFIELPPGGNCDGPPADVAQGQQLVQQVVEAVVTSPNWSSTMLIVVYDEHGGFYDHVPPPAAAQVAPGLPATYGVRVPAFVVSPWVAGGTVFGNDSNTSGPAAPATYFDHTSILKTITRRFLNGSTPASATNQGNPPPYMGARFAAANDLSSIITSQPRTSPFLPFIAYNLVFVASQKQLEVQDANAAPGTILLQDDPQDTVAQQFSFEDAGNGYFYIRTHTGSLYLTVDVPPPGSGTPQSYSVKQDVKYTAGGADGNNPNYQIWSLLIFEPSVYPFTVQNVDIGCPAFKDWVLQPLGGSLQSGTPIVLAPETGVSGLGVIATQQKYSWAISRYVQGKLVSVITALSFLPQQVGDVNARTAQSVTLTVSDGSPLIVYSVAITSDTGAAGDFASVPPPGAPPPGGSVNIQNGQLVVEVWFLPTAAGPRAAQLEIGHNLGNSPLVIQLSGQGVAAPVPLLTFTPSSLFFTPKKVTTHTVTLTNTGTGPLTISSIAASNSNFKFTTSCNVGPGAITLQPNQSCTVNVGYNFIGPGGSSELVITHNADGSPAVIDLEATSKTGVDP
jgi:phospholipase C